MFTCVYGKDLTCHWTSAAFCACLILCNVFCTTPHHSLHSACVYLSVSASLGCICLVWKCEKAFHRHPTARHFWMWANTLLCLISLFKHNFSALSSPFFPLSLSQNVLPRESPNHIWTFDVQKHMHCDYSSFYDKRIRMTGVCLRYESTVLALRKRCNYMLNTVAFIARLLTKPSLLHTAAYNLPLRQEETICSL